MKLSTITLSGLLFCAMSAHAATMPRTLFEMAGAKPEAARLADSVLVIVDAQREYVDGALPLEGVNEAVAEIGKLLGRARKAGMPVIHIMHKGADALFNRAGSGFEIVAALKPLPGEAVVEKMRVSAFAGTGLDELVRQTGRKKLVIVGFMTHNCIDSTARAARDLGYAPTIVAAATATRALPDGQGGIISTAALQAATLAALADRNAAVVLSASDIPD